MNTRGQGQRNHAINEKTSKESLNQGLKTLHFTQDRKGKHPMYPDYFTKDDFVQENMQLNVNQNVNQPNIQDVKVPRPPLPADLHSS